MTFGLVWALLAPAGLGWLALRALGLRMRDDAIAAPAWAWLLGCLSLATMLQLALELGVPPVAWWAAPLPAAAAFAWLARRRVPVETRTAPPAGRAFVTFVVLGAALALWLALAGMDRPCVEGDEGNIWSLKAKSLLVDWPAGFATAQVYNLHPDYPQLNPLLQSWVYALTAVPDFVQFENRWLVQLCDVALFVAVAGALRRRLPAFAAAPLAALVLLEPEFGALCRTAYADGMVALGVVVALDAGLRWRGEQDRRHAWLAAFAFAFALWSKNETMLYAAAACGAAVLARLLRRAPAPGATVRDFVLLWPAAAVVAFTFVTNRRFGMRSDLLGENPTGKSMFTLMAEQWPERVPAMLAEAGRLFVDLSHAHVAFLLLLVLAFAGGRRLWTGPLGVPVLALLTSFVGLHVVYVGSFLPLRFHLDTSYTRVLFQLLPGAVVLLGAVLADVVGTRDTGHTAHRP